MLTLPEPKVFGIELGRVDWSPRRIVVCTGEEVALAASVAEGDSDVPCDLLLHAEVIEEELRSAAGEIWIGIVEAGTLYEGRCRAVAWTRGLAGAEIEAGICACAGGCDGSWGATT